MQWFSLPTGIVITAIVLLTAVAGRSQSLPFAPGEKLLYEVRWEQVPVADLSLSVAPMARVRGEPAFHFVFQAQTKPAITFLYPVTGTIDAFTDLAVTRSLRLAKNMQEGRSRRIFSVDFDWQRGIATYQNAEQRKRRMGLDAGTLDMVSILYFARTLTLEEGAGLSRPLSSGKKIRQARARVIGRETVVVGGRPWPAFRIQADVRGAGGVFAKDRTSTLRLWISADPARLPLKVESKVWVGAFTIELTRSPQPVAQRPLLNTSAFEAAAPDGHGDEGRSQAKKNDQKTAGPGAYKPEGV